MSESSEALDATEEGGRGDEATTEDAEFEE
jgi:hypothetical protein